MGGGDGDGDGSSGCSDGSDGIVCGDGDCCGSGGRQDVVGVIVLVVIVMVHEWKESMVRIVIIG